MFLQVPTGPNLLDLRATELSPRSQSHSGAALPTVCRASNLCPWCSLPCANLPQGVTGCLCVQNNTLAFRTPVHAGHHAGLQDTCASRTQCWPCGEWVARGNTVSSESLTKPPAPLNPPSPVSHLRSHPTPSPHPISSLTEPQKPTLHLQPLSKASSQRKTVPFQRGILLPTMNMILNFLLHHRFQIETMSTFRA